MQKKKRALIFIEDGSFSYDNRVIREADALLEDGWDITVISPKYPDDPFYKRISDNLRAYFYVKPNAESALGHIFEHAITLIAGSVLTLAAAIRHRFSVFHACNPMDILWLIALPYKIFGVKIIFDQHDLCPELYLSRKDGSKDSLFYKALFILEKYAYKTADVVIATNESYKENAVRRGGKRTEEVFVVRNGPDLNKFRIVPPRTDLKNNEEILVGYLGNMNMQDGVDYLLNSASEVVNQYGRNDIRFVLVGGGSMQKDLQKLAVDMGLKNNVSFTGRIPDDIMLSTLCACDICVQPDPLNPLNDKSTMNKVLEYMSLEKPVIAFDLVETRVSCGDAALYVEPNDCKEFADKIIYLADNRATREVMGKAGRERIENSLSWKYSTPKLIAAYDHVMEV